MVVGGGGELAAFGGSSDEAGLEEEGFYDVFEGVAFFAHGGGHGVDADGAAFVVAGHDGHEAAVEGIEAEVVDAFEGEGLVQHIGCEVAVGADDGEIADAAEEAVGDARGAAGAGGDLEERGGIGGEF